MKYTLFLVSALCALTLGAPIERRATPSSVSCGGRSYSASQINGAISNGVNDRASSSSYPHRYNNYEGFDFSDRCSSTSFQEFPLKSSPYTGGSPGPDRVIYGTNSGAFCGAIYHASSSDNSFVRCSY
ncbi:putative ribonuclease T1 [Tilletiopsis washingtonensis]|uniref:Putative ribonuclease T1 n=1 Tax=Tilletiopsis washingtonensis TaxID=58919 RepID=A0A316ZD74_9BASI|nr:putative ribonuclease T1 [Tilletiopsis washingtonensis]PWN99640.1 putative ribonuclease T1 [Tilletiopsis washingtonensis]